MVLKNGQNAAEDSGIPELNMTPMIDVVFQLLIFFMLVTNMDAVNIERVALPKSAYGVSIGPRDDRQVTVSVAHREDIECPDYAISKADPRFSHICRQPGHWLLKYRRDSVSEDQLVGRLRMAVEDFRRDPTEPEISDLPLMIRADKRAPWEEIQRILALCVRPDNKLLIWKTQLGVELENKKE